MRVAARFTAVLNRRNAEAASERRIFIQPMVVSEGHTAEN